MRVWSLIGGQNVNLEINRNLGGVCSTVQPGCRPVHRYIMMFDPVEDVLGCCRAAGRRTRLVMARTLRDYQKVIKAADGACHIVRMGVSDCEKLVGRRCVVGDRQLILTFPNMHVPVCIQDG